MKFYVGSVAVECKKMHFEVLKFFGLKLPPIHQENQSKKFYILKC